MKRGLYGGGTIGSPFGAGFGLYADSDGNLYPQLYFGSPGWSVSGGSTPDLEGLLTGLSVAGTLGRGRAGPNVGTSGGATGFGFGTPGGGATYGFGPYNIRDIGESFRPRTDEFGQPFPGSEAPALPSPSNNSGSQGAMPNIGNPVLRFLDSFRPTTDEFGNPFSEQQSLGGVLKYGEGNGEPATPELTELSPGLVPDADSEAETDASPDIWRLASRVIRLT
jgi:hypothetical protein